MFSETRPTHMLPLLWQPKLPPSVLPEQEPRCLGNQPKLRPLPFFSWGSCSFGRLFLEASSLGRALGSSIGACVAGLGFWEILLCTHIGTIISGKMLLVVLGRLDWGMQRWLLGLSFGDHSESLGTLIGFRVSGLGARMAFAG